MACCRCCTSCSRSRGGSRPRGSRPAPTILDISAAEVSGVATFYTMYKRKPVGDYLVGVCTNTLCAVMGGDAIFERLKDHLDVGQRRDHRGRQGHPRARRVQRGLRLRAGDDGQLGVHGQHDAGLGGAARRRPARGQGGHLHPRPAHLHVEGGRAGAGRLPRRPGRRGAGCRTRLAGRAGAGPREQLDRPEPDGDGPTRRPSTAGPPRPSRVRSPRPTPPAPRPRP